MRLITSLMVVALGALPARGVVLGQVDTFDAGSMQNWDPYPSGIVAPGGAAGIDDGYLRITANDRPLGTHNRAQQWSGNYLAAGVNAIVADLVNFGPATLVIRAVLEGSGGSVFTSTAAFILPPDSQWRHAIFSLAPGDLTLVHQKIGDYTATLSNLDGLVLRYQPGAPSFGNVAVTSSLGMDNVTALPEPSSVIGLALAGVAWCMRRRWRRF